MRSRTTPPALFQALDNDDFKIFCEYQQSPRDFLITYQELTILEYAASQEKYWAVLEIVRIIEKFDYEGSKGFCKHFRLYETFDKLGGKGNPESLLAVVNLIIKKQVCDHNIIVTLDKCDRFKLLIDQKLWSIIKTIITPERLKSWEIASKPLSLPVFIEKNFPV